jgi:quercetin dioxygenase-like cupin family protein
VTILEGDKKMNTRLAVSCLLTLLAVGLSPNAMAVPLTPGTSVTQLFRKPLADRPGTDVVVIRVDYGPGAVTPLHTHPGLVYAYVLHGEVVSQIGDAKPETYRQGQMWSELPWQHHVSRNASPSQPASFLVFFVIPHDAPLTIPLSTSTQSNKTAGTR